MEAGTRNSRFTRLRHGIVTDRTVRQAGETQKGRGVCQSRLNEN
ncbi:hypothetical protein ENTCAN_07855 [Enterobacter cancerogenus ATCC 35316]|nr:hypothetical protein ENTCAN_07855 [Enterobacter cancerogenus ATCC 35316]